MLLFPLLLGFLQDSRLQPQFTQLALMPLLDFGRHEYISLFFLRAQFMGVRVIRDEEHKTHKPILFLYRKNYILGQFWRFFSIVTVMISPLLLVPLIGMELGHYSEQT